MKRLVAIGFIWAMCALAWLVLARTIEFRTGESSGVLLEQVHRLWGPPLSLYAPEMTWTRVYSDYRKDETFAVPLVATSAQASLALEHRRKGLLWFPTYALSFQGTYAWAYAGDGPQKMKVFLPIPPGNIGLDGFDVRDAKGEPVPYEIRPEGAVWTADVAPGQIPTFRVAFRTRGTSSWRYQLTGNGTGQVRDFDLRVVTDFDEVDFPAGTLSPTRHSRSGSGWAGEWDFDSLISSAAIGIDLPQRLNPGVVASRITWFAPLGLLFFFFVVSILAAAAEKNLHPLNYFFLACAFFAFHLLFAYLVDHLPIAPSFALASLTATILVVTYARWFVGWKFALREMGGAQLLYLVLFSFTFFWDGFTGLAITLGAILTLFAMMQVTGKLDWSAVGAKSPPPGPPSSPIGTGSPIARDLAGVVEVFAKAIGAKPEARG